MARRPGSQHPRAAGKPHDTMTGRRQTLDEPFLRAAAPSKPLASRAPPGRLNFGERPLKTGAPRRRLAWPLGKGGTCASGRVDCCWGLRARLHAEKCGGVSARARPVT
eukprot:15137762-Alexandrium_andersonii.AAC.1